MTERLQELADLCEARKLTPAELNEAFDLSIGAETIAQLELMLETESPHGS